MPSLPCHPAKTGLGFQEPPLNASLGLQYQQLTQTSGMTADSNRINNSAQKAKPHSKEKKRQEEEDEEEEEKKKKEAHNFQLPQKINLPRVNVGDLLSHLWAAIMA